MLSELSYQSKVENNQVYFTYPATKRTEKNLWEEKIPPTENNGIDVDGWHLPGQFEKRVGLCGIWSYMGCLNKLNHPGNKIFLKPFQKSCFRADCEKCCWKWCFREASKSTHRMETYAKKSKRKVKHIILSVPRSDYYKEKKYLSKKAYQILKEINADSGLVIFHPFRINKDTRAWEYSPHFHVLGFGWVTAVAKAYAKHGWVIKNKGLRKSVMGTIHYTLTHCGIKKKYHALTYFGACSYSKLKLKPEELESRNCPFCQEKLESVEWAFEQGIDSGFPPDPNIMEVWYLIESYEWYSNKS